MRRVQGQKRRVVPHGAVYLFCFEHLIHPLQRGWDVSSALEHAAVGEARGLLLRGKLLLGIHLPQLGGTLRRVAENDLEERLELGKIELPAVIVVAHSKQLRNLLVTRRS